MVLGLQLGLAYSRALALTPSFPASMGYAGQDGDPFSPRMTGLSRGQPVSPGLSPPSAVQMFLSVLWHGKDRDALL